MTTASEDIRDVLTVLRLVSARPCIVNKATPKARGTAIGYAELTSITKRLTAALGKIETDTYTHGVNGDGFVCADPEDADGWRVSWNQRLTSPRFNSYGAASAYMELLARGDRQPEYSE